MNTLLDAIDHVERNGNQHGGEWHAPRCPWCGYGEDRLVIWPDHSRQETGMVWCRRCDKSCDGIEFVRKFRDMSWQEACKFFGVDPEIKGDGSGNSGSPTVTVSPSQTSPSTSDSADPGWKPYDPPGQKWRNVAREFAIYCRAQLWSGTEAAKKSRQYLYNRGLNEETINQAGLGFNPEDKWPRRTDWGLDSPNDTSSGKMWLPQGIVIPSADDDGISGINIRRPPRDVSPDAEDQWLGRKYSRASGPSAPLYGSQWVQKNEPVVIVEGEFDALAIWQEAGDFAAPVATLSTGGARRRKWRDLLSQASTVLVAFDAEDPGERASWAWLDALPNATRWRPHAGDTAEMLKQDEELRFWVRCGIQAATSSHSA